jgi:serine/threonine protein phosphatase PrpC
MGSTLVSMIRDGEDMGIAHVGDSRCYRLREGKLEPPSGATPTSSPARSARRPTRRPTRAARPCARATSSSSAPTGCRAW